MMPFSSATQMREYGDVYAWLAGGFEQSPSTGCARQTHVIDFWPPSNLRWKTANGYTNTKKKAAATRQRWH
mgnify:FL=1